MLKDEYLEAKAAAAKALAADPVAMKAAAEEEAAVKASRVQVLQAEKANLAKLSADLKGSGIGGPFVPEPHSQSVHLKEAGSSSTAMLVETHSRVGGTRTARAYYMTPWDCTGMDGGSVESLLKRYSADMSEIDAKIAKLKA
jgi:hypothetical protein